MKLFTHSQTSTVHKAITCTSVHQSAVRYCGINLRIILQDILKISVLDMSLKISKITATLLRANELYIYLPAQRAPC